MDKKTRDQIIKEVLDESSKEKEPTKEENYLRSLFESHSPMHTGGYEGFLMSMVVIAEEYCSPEDKQEILKILKENTKELTPKQLKRIEEITKQTGEQFSLIPSFMLDFEEEEMSNILEVLEEKILSFVNRRMVN